MFQITIIDQTLAKLISPPKFLKEILEEMNLLISDQYINPEIIEDIKKVFPSLVITKLSSKTRIKRYTISERVQSLINQAEKNNLTNQEKLYLTDLKEHASRHVGLGPTQYYLLKKMVSSPLEKLQPMIEHIKNHPELTEREKKTIEKFTVFNNLKLADIIEKTYNRLKDKVDYGDLAMEYDDFNMFKHIKPDPTTYDRVKAYLTKRETKYE